MRRWMQVTSGRGPAECGWMVPRVLQRITEDADRLKIEVEVLETAPGKIRGTLYSALLALQGYSLKDLMQDWVGSVLWIGTSPFRPNHKRKNWYVGVHAMAVPERPVWSEQDLRFQAMRASGPGGQHVNKTSSAIRVTHLPTGLAAKASEERSQIANRKLALARLASLLEERACIVARKVQQQRWSNHHGLERGNPVRIFKGPDFLPADE